MRRPCFDTERCVPADPPAMRNIDTYRPGTVIVLIAMMYPIMMHQ